MHTSDGNFGRSVGSLYFHFPFCEKKCLYCDFYSVESQVLVNPFLNALQTELELAAASHEPGPVTTVFFGGGTPSLLSLAQMEKVLNQIYRTWNVSPDAEITLETNPGTVNREKLQGFRSLGVNRLSIGIQSFRSEELKFLDRIHDSQQAVRCVEDARAAGFSNVSIDLIYSLPGQTEKAWIESLQKGLALSPDHVSAYSLIVEERTPLFKLVHEGLVVPSPPETEALLYEKTMEVMAAAGYDHYEVSSYARPGHRCNHNLAYWHHHDYLGFGPSAHSFRKNHDEAHGTRWSNVADVASYVKSLNEQHLPVTFRETVGTKELVEEAIFLGLRSDGIALDILEQSDALERRRTALPIIEDLIDRGMAKRTETGVCLTDKGYLLCDEIVVRLISG